MPGDSRCQSFSGKPVGVCLEKFSVLIHNLTPHDNRCGEEGEMALKGCPATFTVKHFSSDRGRNSSIKSKIRTIPLAETGAGNSQEFCWLIGSLLDNGLQGDFTINNPCKKQRQEGFNAGNPRRSMGKILCFFCTGMGSMIGCNDIYPVPASPEVLSLPLGTEWRVNLPERIIVLKVF